MPKELSKSEDDKETFITLTLAGESQGHREWPIEVFDLLRNRGSMPDALRHDPRGTHAP